MRGIFVFSCCLFVSMVAYAQEPAKPAGNAPDPKAIVQKSAEAIGKLKVVAYDVEFKVTGFFEMFLPNINGSVILGKEAPDGAKRFSCKVKVQKPGSAEVTEVMAGADGTTYYLFDHAKKTVYADIDPQVMGKQRDGIDFALTPEFGMAHPFEDALKGGEIKYLRDETVGGQDCWVLLFESALSKPFMDWYFSKSDFLPRRVGFSFEDPKGNKGGSQATILNLKVDPKLDKDPFALVVPEGYKRTDAFAP